ncbi:UDP-N-acetylmuramoyl-L-alanine--D-glutamate ligase [Pseudoduganella umbonata]|uniref:UDP-N-acetylmuramoylalanine--D-glutamate ligase n=1 Tax=Pseudoduganella umbonata TaxID=864828 RepID=A0A4P8HXP0_9BURK|nr:UDP-N-acetylmuramoyl-L-alanine--D-glutamate ligase [Pseudoduganella umbonata]MBB3224689.1 UDP-N-acetylmuramoylalanine--D-glutamate ligase [Pseudoduganella umbonata]QCP13440.1 UDP-N-acetylmuramoyl-L-alanine--D-glutamate ligase [Pseudoduganella umbonata]
MIYNGKIALVLGLGESGLAMAQWLARCGALLRVADTRAVPDRLPALRETVPGTQFISGPFDAALLDGVDFVAVSPGLAPNRELSQILPAAQQKNIPVWGEIELFAQALAWLETDRGYAPKVIAITGTNGKTTVTTLTGQLCERAGLSVKVAGNISPAALDVLREAMDAAQPEAQLHDSLPQAWVLELSSFQLHTTYSLRADAATVLNLTQDHLDWHGSMEAYAADKARIFGERTVRVLNRDDAWTMRMANPVGTNVTFGTGEPEGVNTFGLVNERGVWWLATAEPTDDAEPAKKRRKNEPVPAVETYAKKLMPADALQIRGTHNATNALAALALCRAIGLPFAPLLHGLRDYRGQPHRVELVASINGVDFYDDSKGTNVGATVAAIDGLGKSFGGEAQKIVLIAGGDGKGQEFDPLAGPVSRYVRAVVLIGRDAPAIRAALAGTGVRLEDFATLEEATRAAAAAALSGDSVLLSPACASLDMFKNYAHRAQVFIDTVRDIALDAGQEI